jgi:hypothetical protein
MVISVSTLLRSISPVGPQGPQGPQGTGPQGSQGPSGPQGPGGKHLLGGTPLRKNYAGIGYSYDPVRDAFIPPKPFNSWILNEDTCIWEPPIPYPTDDKLYSWNEETQSWEESPIGDS